jgi:hypothetical protein
LSRAEREHGLSPSRNTISVAFRLFVLVISLLSLQKAHAQISSGGQPLSVTQKLASAAVPTVRMAAVNNGLLSAQADIEETQAREAGDAIPFAFAYPHAVSLNLQNSGRWETLADGSRLWRLRISSPGAYSLHFVYDHWWLPKGATLFIYNDDHTETIGAFDASNNFPLDSSNVTAPVAGDAATLEYHLQPGVTDEGQLSISQVLHAYRSVRPNGDNPLDVYGQSGPCQVDINCPEGADWQLQKKAVCLLYVPGGGACSGALINNYASNGVPYVLTARHCMPDGAATGWMAQFKYESPNCAGADGPYNFTLSNAYVRARWENTDFMLLEFFNVPPLSYQPFYAGWDRSGNGAINTAGIHHPMTDVKKISIDNLGPYSTDWNGDFDGYSWGVHWDVGRTQPGSSGSPLFSNDGLIIGELHGGMSQCPSEDEPDKYGKFDRSYYGVDGSNASNRLHEWLNPYGIAGTTLNGYYPGPPSNDECANAWNIYSVPWSNTGNTYFADTEYSNCIGGASSPQVWFRLVPFGCPRSIHIDLCGSTFDTEIQVIRGSCGNFLEFVGCNDDGPACASGDHLQAGYTFTALQNESYLIALSGYGAADSGPYSILITGEQLTPVNNNDCNAVVISSFPFSDAGNTTCATNTNTPQCNATNSAPDVEFGLAPPCNMNVNISLCGSDFDTVLELWVSPESFPGCDRAFEFVACNDDGSSQCGLITYSSEINASLTGGRVYRIIVDGYNASAGNYTMTVTATVAGDACPGITIPSLPYVTPYGATTLCGTDNTPPGAPGGLGEGARDLVYSYTPTTCHVCRVSLCGSSYDTALLVYVGTCAAGNLQAYNDDFCGPSLYQSQLDFNARAGNTYYIYVDGYAPTSAGQFIMNVSNVGPFLESHDGCTGLNFTALPYSATGSTICATDNYPHCVTDPSRDMIYTFSLTECTNVTASLCGSNFDTRLRIGSGGQCPGPTLVGCNDDSYCGGVFTYQSQVSWQAQPDSVYRILIHGYNGAAGNYVLNVTGTPCSSPAPDPVNDVVAQFDHVLGDVALAWSAVPGASVYHVYRSPDFATLFDPGNVIADVTDPNFVCAGCLNDPDPISFFGVLADNPLAILAPPAAEGLQLSKAEAVMSEPVALSAPLSIDPNPEFAAPNKAANAGDRN